MIKFYIDTAKHYLNLYKGATDSYSKNLWLEYAQEALERAQERLKRSQLDEYIQRPRT